MYVELRNNKIKELRMGPTLKKIKALVIKDSFRVGGLNSYSMLNTQASSQIDNDA